ncbi:LLM class flavin-dependent oxidoreductase [Nocardioides sp.]|uniref:LLM class flavin-dependent oxidoreductase n=1 Tax=Nocardioides sp. TaxID=35761 RepID=UPI0031FE6047
MADRILDPALVVLVGPSGSAKSTWAASHYRREEIVSSDALRGVVGSGPHDLDATGDAFAILEQVVDARVARGLTVVIDTLGTDAARRGRWLDLARRGGLPAVVVVLDTPDAECRRRNAARDRPVPAGVLSGQLTRHREVAARLDSEAWDLVHVVSEPHETSRVPENAREGVVRHTSQSPRPDRRSSQGLRIVLHVSRFPWGENPMTWLRDIALAADAAGFAGIALMDHLIQIPQVGRAWEPIPEPWVSLGMLAGLDTALDLGPLVTPVTFRPAGVIAKAAATLDVLSGGRAFVGIGAGWWDREHAAYGLPFPSAGDRLDALETAIETVRALWSPGTKAYVGEHASLPETTGYPRPVGRIPVIVGGSGEQRTLRIAARLADAINVPSALPVVDRKIEVLRAHCRDVGRDPSEVAITVLDLPVVGLDREDTWARVEKLRGRTPAGSYVRRTNAGTPAEQRDRYGALADRGVDTVFVSLGDLDGPQDIERVAALCE